MDSTCCAICVTHIFPLIEQWLWTAEEFEQILVIYQRLFREYEALIEDFKILTGNS